MSEYTIVTLDDGTEARQYEDGSLRDSMGAYLRRPPQAADLITTESAPGMLLRRDQIAKDKAADGLQRAVDKGLSLQTASVEDAWGYVIEKQTELATSPEEGHASTQAAKLVGTASGMLGSKAGAPSIAIQVNISDDIAARYLGADWVSADEAEETQAVE